MQPGDGTPGVEVVIKGGKRSRTAGVLRCDNVKLCPCCHRRIQRAREAELRRLVAAARAAGPRVLALTLTHRPFLGPLAEAIEQHNAAVAEFLVYLREHEQRGAVCVLGYVNARDITHAVHRGWHPHRHLILVVRADTDFDLLQRKLFKKWQASVARQGGVADATGWHFEEKQPEDDDEVAHYVMSAAEKDGSDDEHRTIRDLQHAAADGDRRAAWLIREYAAATKGRQAVTSGGVLRITQEPPEQVDENGLRPGEDRIGDITYSVKRILRRTPGLMDDLMGAVARAADGGAARIAFYEQLRAGGVPVPELQELVDWSDWRDSFYQSRAYDDAFPTDWLPSPSALGAGWHTVANDDDQPGHLLALPASSGADIEAMAADVMAENPDWSWPLALEYARAMHPLAA